MAKSSKILVLDSLIIIMNLSLSNTILPFLFISNSYGLNSIVILCVTLLYSQLRFNKVSIPNHTLFVLYVLLNCWCILAGMYTNTLGMGFIPLLFADFVFYVYLYNLYLNYKKDNEILGVLRKLFVGYFSFSLYSIAVTILLWLMVNVFNIYPLINEVSNSIRIFEDNVGKNQWVHYYFPYNIAIMLVTEGRINVPFIQNYGTICGLFHEPQSMGLFVSSVLFIFFSKLYKISGKIRGLFVFCFLFICMQLASVTNILAVTSCSMLFLINKNKKMSWILVPLFVGIILWISSMDNDLINYLTMKLDDKGGSQGYSLTTIAYAFSPRTLIGSSFYDLSYVKEGSVHGDVGLIMFFINLSFLIVLSYYLFVVIRSDHMVIKTLGFAVLCYVLHAMKQAMVIYSISSFVFFFFILTVCYNYTKRKNAKYNSV